MPTRRNTPTTTPASASGKTPGKASLSPFLLERAFGFGSYVFGAMAGGTREVPLSDVFATFGHAVGRVITRIVGTFRAFSSSALRSAEGFVDLYDRVTDVVEQ